MKTFEVKYYDGTTCDFISANDERQALCTFLMNHPEYDDVVFYKSCNGRWYIAPYDCEDEYLYAKLV